MNRRSLLAAFACLPAIACDRPRAPKSDPVVPPSPTPAPPATTEPVVSVTKDYEAHARKLARRLPAGFTIQIEAPFVVAGDDPPETVRRRSRGTVRWAVEQLKRSYFEQDPAEIIDIFLFKDEQSYTHHAWALFRDKPDTPYGYYSSTHRAMVMNIATGGGTLVHEIVHPFVEANFPDCPAWFNEGLGSLYEQSAERNGQIVGLTNWRLRGLQEAIRAKRVPSFEALTATSTSDFYDRDPGTHYAQSRYLMYYLQERAKLRAYYRSFVAAVSTDPTGYQTLRATLGESDMTAFQDRWQDWVLDLRFG